MSNSLVSIIIPCFNSVNTVEATIQSCLAQSHREIEIIAVNDGSSDGTLEILKKYREQILILTDVKKGASAARNRGLNRARGHWIQYLDADDLLHENKLKSQLKAAEENGDGVLYSGEWHPFVYAQENAKRIDNPLFKTMSPNEWLQTSWSQRAMMQPGAWLISRKLIEQAGPWNETLSLDDDGEYFSRVILASEKIEFVDQSIVYYRKGQSSQLSRMHQKQHLKSGFESVRLQVEHFLEHDQSDTGREAAADRWWARAYELYLYDRYWGEKAFLESQKLGGSTLEIPGGSRYRKLEKALGWRWARRLQGITYEYRDMFRNSQGKKGTET